MLILIPTQDGEQAEHIGEQAVAFAGMECDCKVQIDTEGVGFTKTVNEGFEGVNEYVCLLNDDCVPVTNDWLAVLKGEMDKREALNVWFAGPSGPCRTPPQASGRVGDKRRPQVVDHLAGFCLLVHPDALRELGTLDERFTHYASEVDWQWRAQRDHKARALWVPEVYVKHEVHPPANEEWWRQDQALLNGLWRR